MALPVFTDASSAILLQKAGLFDLFSKAFRVVFAQSVFQEITRAGYFGADFFLTVSARGQVSVAALSETSRPEENQQKRAMGHGEWDTLCLFMKNKTGFVLMDDKKGARWCMGHGLPFINALLVPKILCYTGLMDEAACKHSMEYLCKTGRYGQNIIAIAYGLSKNDLLTFIPEKKP